MWKIKIDYQDGSRLTFTGKHKDIPYLMALTYFQVYAKGEYTKAAIYQQYPIKNHAAISLEDKIKELKELGVEV